MPRRGREEQGIMYIWIATIFVNEYGGLCYQILLVRVYIVDILQERTPLRLLLSPELLLCDIYYNV